MEEIWKPVVGFEGIYEVSSLGRIKTIKTGRIRKSRACDRDYHDVCLSRNGKQVWMRRCRVVAMAFHPNPDNKPQVNHKNLKHDDDRAENLEWCTQAENMTHYSENMTNKGSGHPRALFTDEQIEAIKKDRETKTLEIIAAQYGTSPTVISDICNGKTYSGTKRSEYVGPGMPSGEQCHLSKLTVDSVKEIKSILAAKGNRRSPTDAEIGSRFGITAHNVRAIKYGLTWRSVQAD